MSSAEMGILGGRISGDFRTQRQARHLLRKMMTTDGKLRVHLEVDIK